MQTIKKIYSKTLLVPFWILLAITYSQLSYADSKEYLTKWYEYKLQTTKPGTIDNSTIDEIVDDLANNKKPIYSLIVDSNSLPTNMDVLEKILGALKTNTTIRDLSFFNFSGENIEKITRVLNSKVFPSNKDIYYGRDCDWLVSVDFTNRNDNTNVIIEESAAVEIGLLIKKGLISLNLSGNEISTDNLVTIVQELPSSKLTHLYLNKIKITKGGIHAFANTLRKENNKLTFLALDQNNIDPDSAIQLVDAVSKNSFLQSISLAENNIGNSKEAMKTIRKFYQCKNGIYNINLAKNNLMPIDISELMSNYNDGWSCNGSPKLTLNLAENKIDSTGAMTIANSKCWLELNAIINLGGNNIGFDSTMTLIKTAYTKEQIEGLNFRMADIENPIAVTNEHIEL